MAATVSNDAMGVTSPRTAKELGQGSFKLQGPDEIPLWLSKSAN